MQGEKAILYVIKGGFDRLFDGKIIPELVEVLIFAVVWLWW